MSTLNHIYHRGVPSRSANQAKQHTGSKTHRPLSQHQTKKVPKAILPFKRPYCVAENPLKYLSVLFLKLTKANGKTQVQVELYEDAVDKKKEKWLKCVVADALVCPHAVVVHHEDALVALFAVMYL